MGPATWHGESQGALRMNIHSRRNPSAVCDIWLVKNAARTVVFSLTGMVLGVHAVQQNCAAVQGVVD